MFELSQLRCFVVVAEELHFGRAATRLNMTQPPLSRQIQMLERIFGTRLFNRSSRSVELTTAGIHLLPEARRILALSESSIKEIRRLTRGEAGSLSIGFTASAGSSFLPMLLMRCREQLTNVQLELKEMVTREQTEALTAGQIDIGLLRPPAGPHYHSICVLQDRLLAALPASHSLATGAAPAIEDFNNLPFIMYSPDESEYFYDLVTSIFRERGVSPDFVQHVTQIHSILALVRAGLGVALVPEAASNLQFAGVSLRPLTTQPARPVELLMAWLPNNSNPVMKRVLDIARTLAARQKNKDAPWQQSAINTPRASIDT